MENTSSDYIWISANLFKEINKKIICHKTYDEYFEFLEKEYGLLRVSIAPFEIEIPKTHYRLFKVINKGKALKFFFDYIEYTEKPEKKILEDK